ncbi:MAG: response regulator transcription factor [Anaerotignum sp.]|nr:response regulator transcription factor [Anaerotignum sp.]
MNKSVILIIEDDYDIRRANRAALELVGYSVFEAESLTRGRSIAEEASPDLIILDVLLPDGNSLCYCEELRGKNGACILFLSALNTKADILAGLRSGGDDYISKPYDMDELILRVEVLLRRGRLVGHEEAPLQVGGLRLDFTTRRASLDGRDLLLKPKEFSLLEILLRKQGQIISADELYQKVWGMDAVGDVHTVKEHISRIRGKLGNISTIRIEVERGRGYCLNSEE